jgi:integrase
MSITKYTKQDGTNVYRHRWTTNETRRSRTFTTKRAAKEHAELIRAEHESRLPQFLGMTLQQLWEKHWNTNIIPNTTATTQRTYQILWDAHAKYLLGKRPVQDFVDDPFLLDQWLAERREYFDGTPNSGDATLQKVVGCLLGPMFSAAVRWKIIRSNPVDAIKKPSHKRERAVRPLSPDQIRSLIDGLVSPQERLAIALMGFAGLRPSEALALEWADVQDHTIWVDKGLTANGIGSTKTGSIRAVLIRGELRSILSDTPQGTGRLLSAWDATTFKYWCRGVFRPRNMRAYDLRHSFASQLVREGLSVVEVAAELGHRPEMTLSTYAHLFAEQRHSRLS